MHYLCTAGLRVSPMQLEARISTNMSCLLQIVFALWSKLLQRYEGHYRKNPWHVTPKAEVKDA